MADVDLDCKGLNCPLPIVKISQTMKKMEVGQTVSVEATDPAFKADLEAWVERLGHELVAFEEDDCFKATLRKQEKP